MQRFCIVSSMRSRTPKMVVTDIDGHPDGVPYASEAERSALRHLVATGVLLVVATINTPDTLRRHFDQSGLPIPYVITLDMPFRRAAPLRVGTPGEDAPTQLVRLARAHNASLQDVAVIACTPYDLPLALEAGTTWAVADAGRSCLAAADRVFPSRARGGLSQALASLADAISRGSSG